MRLLIIGIVVTVVGFLVAPLAMLATQPGTAARSSVIVVGGWVFVAGLVLTVVGLIRAARQRRRLGAR